jgi:uncharacterized protein involved in exopolysaccharide biosynthesis
VSSPASDSAEITLADVARALAARKGLIVLAAVVAGAVAGGASYLVRPVFRAEVLVAPAGEERGSLGAFAQLAGLAELAGVNLAPQAGSKAAALATLKSRSLTTAFIDDHKLLPALFERQWDVEARRWKADDPEKVPTLWDAYRVFDRDVRRVQEDRKSGLVTLSIDWHDPVAAADWANELVRRANAKLQQETIAEGQKTIAFLEQQLGKAGAVEVRQALYTLVEAETKKVAVAHAREQFGFKIIDPAVPPKRRFSPNRAAISLAGLLLGLVGSSLAVLFWAFTRDGARAA